MAGVVCFLLVCQSVAAVEQLLSGEPVIRYIAGLAADQVVRHGALPLLARPAQLFHSFENQHLRQLSVFSALVCGALPSCPRKTPAVFLLSPTLYSSE